MALLIGRCLALFLATTAIAIEPASAAAPACDDRHAAADRDLRLTAASEWRAAIARHEQKGAKSDICRDLQAAITAQRVLIDHDTACRRTTSLLASHRVLMSMYHSAHQWRCAFDDDDDDDDDDGDE